MERQGQRRQQQKVRSRILPKLVYRLASRPCGHHLARRLDGRVPIICGKPRRPHLKTSTKEKMSQVGLEHYLLLGLSFETRLLADGLRGACCTILKPAPSVASISSCDTGGLLTHDFCVLVSMWSCEAFSQEQYAKQDARWRQR